MKTRDPSNNGKAVLPAALRQRWQPIRGGLLNIYRYDYQEFRYEDGRLLLRGNNGTGKSRVLALQLPFLLDGEIVPQRVEPDGDPAKRMEWNLLFGGKYDDRLGYTWLEFGRLNDQGEGEYKTLGCGLRAVQGRGIAQQWFFITNQRIGRDLFLVNEAEQPLSKAKLETAIGDHGKVFGSGKIEDDRRNYRDAVNIALFNLGDRYDALLNLLIQLRQPQLSRKLEEDRLSNALSQALPPLPDAVLGDVAEAFRSLETDRSELENFKAARDSAELFLKEYKRYVQIAARRRAEDVRKAHSAYETTMRRLRATQTAFEQAEGEVVELDKQIAQLSIAEQRAMAAESALRDSPEMKEAKALAIARAEAEAARLEAEDAGKQAERSATALMREEQQRAAAEDKRDHAVAAVESATTKVLEAARAAGLEQQHRGITARFRPEDTKAVGVESLAAALGDLVKRRLDAARHVQGLNQQVESARQQLIMAQQAFNQAEGQLNESVETERKAVSELGKETTALFDAYRTWAANTTVMKLPDADEIEAAFANWCEIPEGDSPAIRAIKDAERNAVCRIESERADAETRFTAANQQLAVLEADIIRARDGYHEPPPTPHTRDSERRATRPGAPFWAVCDFLPSVPECERAGIEAALEASGLLDAWLTPDGRLLDHDDQDTILVAGISSPAPQGAGLALVLAPSIDRQDARASALTEATVSAVLRHIGFGADAGPIWVDRSGQWQLGPLRGAWGKAAAQHLGHASREAARRLRMAALEKEIEAAKQASNAIQQKLTSLAQRTSQLRQEVAQAPNDGNVRRALAQVEAFRQSVMHVRSRLTEAEVLVAERRRAMSAATEERTQTAADLGVADGIDRIPALIDLTHAYNHTLAELWPAIRAQTDAQSHLAIADERVAEALRSRNERNAHSQKAQGKAAAALETFQVLESTVGAGVREVQKKLENATKRVVKVRTTKTESEQKRNDKQVEKAVAQAKITEVTSELEARELERKGAITGLVAFAGTRQLAVAHTDFSTIEPGPWSVARAVELSRRIEAALSGTDHGEEAWNRNQRDIYSHFETLQSSLRAHGYMPEASMNDGVFVVSIQFQGRSCTIAELRDNVVTIIQERQELLDAREREVLENYLIDEVAEHLHDLLHRALKWKEEVNAELRERPMSTGMMLKFLWEPLPDLPAAFTEARRLLLSARGTWSAAERKAVGEFLQQRIKAVRTANDTGTWQDHLAEAFDYRKWHRFGVERKQDGVWKRLTRRTHGTGSGGEKATALTLPQLAAAAAHYRTADKNAPRLILLDEVFVGVDKNMRAKCMDLLRVFDLDVMMTSESEWACYPTVPAIGIYHLSTREGIDAVHATRWVWNGKQRVRDDSPFPEARPPVTNDTARLLELP
jgi:uncharacterized protein (TIGR02680 family)